MWIAFVSWFAPVVWAAIALLLGGAALDLAATVLVIAFRCPPGSLSWRKLPQFLLTNVLPYSLGALLLGALLRFYPELTVEYLTLVGAATVYMDRDVRLKLKVLFGAASPDTLPGWQADSKQAA